MHFLLLQVGSESYSLDKAFTKKESFDFDSSSPKIIRTVIVRVSFLITQFIILWWIQTRMNWMSSDCLSSGNEMWIIFGKFYLMPEEAFIKLKLKMAGTLKPLQSKNLNPRWFSSSNISLTFPLFRYDSDLDGFKADARACVQEWKDRIYEQPASSTDPHFPSFSPYQAHIHEPVRATMMAEARKHEVICIFFIFYRESQQVLLKILSMPSKIRILKFLQKKNRQIEVR